MDTTILSRELSAAKSKFDAASQKKRSLTTDIVNLKPKVATYKRDLEEVETKLKAKTDELADIDNQINKYADEIKVLDRDFKKMVEELKRVQANSTSAPTSGRRYG